MGGGHCFPQGNSFLILPSRISGVAPLSLTRPTAMLHSRSVGSRYACRSSIKFSSCSFSVSHLQNAIASNQLTFTAGSVAVCGKSGGFIMPPGRAAKRFVILHPRFPHRNLNITEWNKLHPQRIGERLPRRGADALLQPRRQKRLLLRLNFPAD